MMILFILEGLVAVVRGLVAILDGLHLCHFMGKIVVCVASMGIDLCLALFNKRRPCHIDQTGPILSETAFTIIGLIAWVIIIAALWIAFFQ